MILRALAEATTSTSTAPVKEAGGDGGHIMPGWHKGAFQLHDLNRLMTLNRRINEAWAGGTPEAAYSNGVTDLYVSPEVKEGIRSFAYNPLNTTGASADFDQTLPDNIRSDIYHQAGMQSIYGVNILELVELGVGKKYNTLFDEFASTTDWDAGAGTHAFDGGTTGDQVLVGIDNSRGAFIRPVARQWDSGGDGTYRALPDEQFNMYGSRVEKTGFYGFLEEGRICIDARAIMGLIL